MTNQRKSPCIFQAAISGETALSVVISSAGTSFCFESDIVWLALLTHTVETETLLLKLCPPYWSFWRPPNPQLNRPTITFCPLSASHVSTSSLSSLCFHKLADIVIFPPLYLSAINLNLFGSHFHAASITFSQSRPPTHQCSILSETDWWTISLFLSLWLCNFGSVASACKTLHLNSMWIQSTLPAIWFNVDIWYTVFKMQPFTAAYLPIFSKDFRWGGGLAHLAWYASWYGVLCYRNRLRLCKKACPLSKWL